MISTAAPFGRAGLKTVISGVPIPVTKRSWKPEVLTRSTISSRGSGSRAPGGRPGHSFTISVGSGGGAAAARAGAAAARPSRARRSSGMDDTGSIGDRLSLASRHGDPSIHPRDRPERARDAGLGGPEERPRRGAGGGANGAEAGRRPAARPGPADRRRGRAAAGAVEGPALALPGRRRRPRPRGGRDERPPRRPAPAPGPGVRRPADPVGAGAADVGRRRRRRPRR